MTDTETKTNQDDLAKAMLDGLKELIKTTAKDNTDSKFSYEQREELSDMIYERVEEQIEDVPMYVLQSTDEDKYDDHINCVRDPEELADQSSMSHIYYSGTKTLSNGMKRFMVIGR